MTAIDSHKLQHISDRVQVVLLDEKGFVCESCDTLLPLSKLKKSVFPEFSDFDIIRLLLEKSHQKQDSEVTSDDSSKEKKSLVIEYKKLSFEGKELTADMYFSFSDNNTFPLIWVLEDVTGRHEVKEHERNEAEKKIEEQHLEMAQEFFKLKHKINVLQEKEDERIRDFKTDFMASLQRELDEPVSLLRRLGDMISEYEKNKPFESDTFTSGIGKSLFLLNVKFRDMIHLEKGGLPLRKRTFSQGELFDFLRASVQYQNVSAGIDFPPPEFQNGVTKTFFGDFERTAAVLSTAWEFALQVSSDLFLSVSPDTDSEKQVCFIIEFEDTHSTEATRQEAFRGYYEGLRPKIKIERFGFGLDIASKMTEAMGGVMTYERKNDSRCVIKICLPLSHEENLPEKKIGSAELYLYNPAEAEFLKHELNDLGISAEIKQDLKEIGRNKNTVIVVDRLRLAQFKNDVSPETYEEICKHFENPKALSAVLLVRGDKGSDLPDYLLKSYLHKPVNPKQLFKKIKNLLNRNENEPAIYHERIDWSQINSIVDGNPKQMLNLLSIMKKNMEEFPDQMQEEYVNGDLSALRETAHKFKSCTAYTGLKDFNTTLTEIEISDEKNYSQDKIEELVSLIIHATITLRVQIDESIQELETRVAESS